LAKTRRITTNVVEVALNYSRAFNDRPPLSASEGLGWLTGTWAIGACYKNPNKLYGAYPRGYLERVHAMFPRARHVLHVFSGGLTEEQAICAAWPEMRPNFDLVERRTGNRPTGMISGPGAPCMELVDVKGPEDGRYPTWQGDVMAMPPEWAGRFDLIMADPPYSDEDAARYGVKMPRRNEVMQALRRVVSKGGNLVWLDQVWPMHRKEQWRCWGQIGLVRSTNHRVRLVSIFEAV